jgi:membrane protein DedA with SNARE-associated domain
MSLFSLHELVQLLHAYGYSTLAVAVALESIGLPLPGESLLIAAAVVAGTTLQLNILLVVIAATVGTIAGQAAGYWIGRAVGFRLLRRYGHYAGLTAQRLAYSQGLFRRHGAKVVILSRFVVLLRTITALLAGANHMPWLPFMAGECNWQSRVDRSVRSRSRGHSGRRTCRCPDRGDRLGRDRGCRHLCS